VFFEKNGDVWNAIRDTTTKNWVEELGGRKRPKQIPYTEKKKKKDTKETAKMSRL